MHPFPRLNPRSWLIRLLVTYVAVGVFSAVGREIRRLNDGWGFHLGDLADAPALEVAPADWSTVNLPHDWSIALPKDEHATSAGGGGFFPTGIGWYRRTLDVPASWQGQRVSLVFDGVYMNAEVWINGVSLGTHPYGYTPFTVDLTSHLKFGVPNLIAVRVDNSAQPNSRWYSGSGIYRPVELIVTGPVYSVPAGVFARTTALSPQQATIRLDREVRNDSAQVWRGQVETIVVDPSGREVARTRTPAEVAAGALATLSAELKLDAPRPWSPQTPVLYRAVTRLWANGAAIDEVATSFGIRMVRVSVERGFELNGQILKLTGANVHAEHGPLGAAAFARAEERKVQLLLAAGFNAVRTAHHPPSSAFLEACDRLGLLVLEEAFDGWEKGKNPHDYSVVMKTWWQRDLDAMVRRDRNHSSVVLWSIGNEMNERANANGLRIARELTSRIRELDPTRPITAGLNGPGKTGDWTKFDPLFATLDVAGYNYELERHVADHIRQPHRVILVTESYLSEVFKIWAASQDFPYIVGDFTWSGIDYLGEAGIGRVFAPGEPIVKHWEGSLWPWHGAACGDIDLTGWRKPVSHYRNIVWDRGERLYAAVLEPSPGGKPWGVSPWATEPMQPSWTWPGHEGEALAVDVYARYDSVRLYLGNRLIGEKPTTRNEEFRARFSVPYMPGELRAVGIAAGREAETFSLQTAGPAVALRIQTDRSVIAGDGQNLAFVTVGAVDAAGQVVPTANFPVRVQVSGPISIAGIGNADLTTSETYTANPHRLYRGRALIVLRAGTKPGTGTLAVSARDFGFPSIRIEVTSDSAEPMSASALPAGK